MNTAPQPMYEWNTIPWKQAEKAVFKLQKRIYQAAGRGDNKTVHKLQRLLMKSWWATLIAVRRVTQDNQGKKTAGVDGVKSLNPKQRLALAKKIQANPFLAKSAPGLDTQTWQHPRKARSRHPYDGNSRLPSPG